MSSERLTALDALRGFTIMGMIVVNSPGSWSHVYAPLLHAPWHGLTPTDLVFPFFLYLVGVSIALSFRKRLDSGVPPASLYRKIAARSLKIFAVGLFLNLWPSFEWADLRIAGVLQRIALVFFVCSLLFLKTGWRQQLGLLAVLLIGYWAALALLPVPLDAVNARALETGQVERAYGQHVEVEVTEGPGRSLRPNYEPGTNLAAWIDRRWLPGRFWERSWDPEGLASSAPAIGTGLLGMLAGALILRLRDPYRRASWLFFAGFCSLLLGEIWSWSFPLNKNLWSSSFVLFTGGLATMGLAACFLLVDVAGYRRWTQAGIVFGSNAIVTYALSGMLLVLFYGGGWGMPSLAAAFMNAASDLGFPPKLASLLYALLYLAALFLPACWLWKHRLFIRL